MNVMMLYEAQYEQQRRETCITFIVQVCSVSNFLVVRYFNTSQKSATYLATFSPRLLQVQKLEKVSDEKLLPSVIRHFLPSHFAN